MSTSRETPVYIYIYICIPYVSLILLTFTQLGNAKVFKKIISARLHLQELSACPYVKFIKLKITLHFHLPAHISYIKSYHTFSGTLLIHSGRAVA